MMFYEGDIYTIVVRQDCIKFLMDSPFNKNRTWHLILFN